MVTCIWIYVVGWVVTTLATYAAVRRLNDAHTPAHHQLTGSVAAGAVWPLLLIGAAEFSWLAMYSMVRSKQDSATGRELPVDTSASDVIVPMR